MHRFVGILLSCCLAPCSAQVVISQLYGGGGNQGSVLGNDYVELFNRGNSAVNLSGWSLQHASASGSNWDMLQLSETIQPGQYFLIRLGQGRSGGLPIPAPDLSSGINLDDRSAKVALVSNTVRLLVASPTSANIVDFVGYGTATFAENGAAPAPILEVNRGAFRKENGCFDSGVNANDFITGTPAPRNRASARNLNCAAHVPLQQLPAISSAGIVSAASYQSGSLTPGEIFVVFGRYLGPTQLQTAQASLSSGFPSAISGVRVLVNGLATPLIYVGANQLSAIAPFSLATRSIAEVVVERDGVRSIPFALPVLRTRPALFTLNASGSGLLAGLNQDGSVHTLARPSRPGEVVVLFATGCGALTGDARDGSLATGPSLPAVEAPVSAFVDGKRAAVLYAGAAPGLVLGLVQVNILLPVDLASGRVGVELECGSFRSQPNVHLQIAN